MTGFGEYDLLGPSAFMTAGMPRRVRSLFEGFGYSRADVTPDVKRRLMALMLLHRASDPISHICIEDWQDEGRRPVRTAGFALAGLRVRRNRTAKRRLKIIAS